MDHEASLPVAVERFIEEHSMSPVTFGRKALNDPHFVRDLRGEAGKRPRRVWPETEAKVRDFMATYQPADLANVA